MDTWAIIPANGTVEDLLAQLAGSVNEADGLTVTGGEPFDQPEALVALLQGWRAMGGGDVLVFSSHVLERLTPTLDTYAGLVDALVTGPFEPLAGQTLALRGSDNQRLVCPTELGQARFGAYERELTRADRVLDVLFDEVAGGVFLAGIPRPGDMRRLAAILDEQGHTAAVSEDRRVAQ